MGANICRDIELAFQLGLLIPVFVSSPPGSPRTKGGLEPAEKLTELVYKALNLQMPSFQDDFAHPLDTDEVERYVETVAAELAITVGDPVADALRLGYHAEIAAALLRDNGGKMTPELRQFIAGGAILHFREHERSLYLPASIGKRFLTPMIKFLHLEAEWDAVRGPKAIDRALARLIKDFHGHVAKMSPAVFDVLWRPGGLAVTPIWKGRNTAPREDLCFILMPFTEPWSESTFAAIGRAVKRCEMRCSRADYLGGDDVMEDIWAELLRAEVVVADVTGMNANVFYELGLAHALGKITILLTQGARDIPFDVNRFRHVIYEPTDDGYEALEKNLIRCIRAGRKDAEGARRQETERYFDSELSSWV